MFHYFLLFFVFSSLSGCFKESSYSRGYTSRNEEDAFNFDVQKYSEDLMFDIRIKSTRYRNELDISALNKVREEALESDMDPLAKKYLQHLIYIDRSIGMKLSNDVSILKDLVKEIKYLYINHDKNQLDPKMLRAALLGVKHCLSCYDDESLIWGLSKRGLCLSDLLALFWASIKHQDFSGRDTKVYAIKLNFIQKLAEAQAERTRNLYTGSYSFEKVAKDTHGDAAPFIAHLMSALPDPAVVGANN